MKTLAPDKIDFSAIALGKLHWKATDAISFVNYICQELMIALQRIQIKLGTDC